ncbi:MAG: exosome complex RNA-binding protein Csl4 [Candidatus Thermoplasmatota archaeon]|nr:exosome complex RNA-binding protein Csl4 [Candidatus Thermoplasmatota archaeon]
MIQLPKTEKWVLPGDEVAQAEEYIAGEGTYEDKNGRVYSSARGILEVDESEKVVKVVPDNPPIVLVEGDTVIANVMDVKPAMVICTIVSQEKKRRAVSSENLAAIHVSKIASSYVEDARDLIRPGDLIRGSVIQALPSVQLTTSGPHLGVLRALCPSCRESMDMKGEKLYCERCERTETRKITDDYRDFEI